VSDITLDSVCERLKMIYTPQSYGMPPAISFLSPKKLKFLPKP